ncbi:unnamed protein product [Aphis gossypii]|uniref:Receptor expression-enhancing protein n=1 Tax=Aphis gossypii TaxID=80765 RepID=A0A9P0IJL8_APHGO|nr:unnamed protein product [Aphis gossypii]
MTQLGLLIIVTFKIVIFVCMVYKTIFIEDRTESSSLLINWCTIGFFTLVEYITDKLFNWLPFYQEIKLGIVLWLYFTFGIQRLYTKIVKPVYQHSSSMLDRFTTITDIMFMNFGQIFWNFTNRAV